MGWAERQADAAVEHAEWLDECERRVPILEAQIEALQAEVASLRAKPPLHIILDRPSDYPEHPVARLALERDDLRRRLMEAAPRWQDGPPPHLQEVWREEPEGPCIVFTMPRARFVTFADPQCEPWGNARWMPIVRPT